MPLRTQRILVACVLAACGAAFCGAGVARQDIVDDNGEMTGEHPPTEVIVVFMVLGAVLWAPFARFYGPRGHAD